MQVLITTLITGALFSFKREFCMGQNLKSYFLEQKTQPIMKTMQEIDAPRRCMLSNGSNSNGSSLEEEGSTSVYTKTDGGSFALHDSEDAEVLRSSSSSKELHGSVDPVLAEKEQWAVVWSRVVVIVVMVAASSILSCVMYSVISRNEHDAFETQVSAATHVEGAAYGDVFFSNSGCEAL
jgi:hypothetical protein